MEWKPLYNNIYITYVSLESVILILHTLLMWNTSACATVDVLTTIKKYIKKHSIIVYLELKRLGLEIINKGKKNLSKNKSQYQ